MNRKWISLLLAVAVGAGAFWVVGARAKDVSGKNLSQYVQAPVERGAIRAVVAGNGPVVASNGLTVRSAQAGVVERILVADGAQVEAGQPILQLRNDAALAALAQAEFDLASQQQSLRNLQQPLRTAVTAQELRLESARLTLQQRQQSVAELAVRAPASGLVAAIAAAEGDSLSPGALVMSLQDEGAQEGAPRKEQPVRLRVGGKVAQVLVQEGARVTEGDLLLVLSNDDLQLSLRQAENDLLIQEQNLANLTNPARDPSGQLALVQARVRQAEASLRQRQSDVSDLQVVAPVSGQLSALAVRPGERVTVNQPLFHVADYGSMQVTIAVDELDIARVREGQRAEVELDALPGKVYAGRVTSLNPEGSRRSDIATFDVTVAIDSPAGLLSGMNATASIEVESRSAALWVPASAVSFRQGKASVRRLENDQPVEVSVQTGLRTPTQVEIVDGLTEGEQIILTIIEQSARGTGGFGGGGFGPGGGMQP